MEDLYLKLKDNVLIVEYKVEQQISKKAMILVGNNKRLKELGFRLLIPVHDELIGECPIENAVECKKLFAQLMSYAAKDRLEVPISCDVEVTKCWYGDTIELEE